MTDLPGNERFFGATAITYDSSTGTGSFIAMTALAHVPRIITFDNQSTVSITISTDGTNAWKSFTAGEAMVMDCNANAGQAAQAGWGIGQVFYAKSAAGTGNFEISVTYVA